MNASTVAADSIENKICYEMFTQNAQQDMCVFNEGHKQMIKSNYIIKYMVARKTSTKVSANEKK